MAKLLGVSRTVRWGLCRCQQCRRHREEFLTWKRTARNREAKLWKKDAQGDPEWVDLANAFLRKSAIMKQPD